VAAYWDSGKSSPGARAAARVRCPRLPAAQTTRAFGGRSARKAVPDNAGRSTFRRRLELHRGDRDQREPRPRSRGIARCRGSSVGRCHSAERRRCRRYVARAQSCTMAQLTWLHRRGVQTGACSCVRLTRQSAAATSSCATSSCMAQQASHQTTLRSPTGISTAARYSSRLRPARTACCWSSLWQVRVARAGNGTARGG